MLYFLERFLSINKYKSYCSASNFNDYFVRVDHNCQSVLLLTSSCKQRRIGLGKIGLYVIQLTPQWGFSVADYIKFPPRLPVVKQGGNYSVRRKPTTFGRVLRNSFYMSEELGSSSSTIENVLNENRTRNLRAE